MTEWTADRLDALPEGTVIVVTWRSAFPRGYMHLGSGLWSDDLGARDVDCEWTSEDLASYGPHSIRVMSVPVDALLTDEAILAAAKAAEEAQGWPWYGLATHHQQVALAAAAVAVRAAIAHITGEES